MLWCDTAPIHIAIISSNQFSFRGPKSDLAPSDSEGTEGQLVFFWGPKRVDTSQSGNVTILQGFIGLGLDLNSHRPMKSSFVTDRTPGVVHMLNEYILIQKNTPPESWDSPWPQASSHGLFPLSVHSNRIMSGPA